MFEIPTPDIIMTWQFWLAAAACWVICEVVKQIPGCPSWLIGVVNIIVGIILLCLLTGWSGENVVAGILCSAMACFAYEFFKKIVDGIAGSEQPNDKLGGTD